MTSQTNLDHATSFAQLQSIWSELYREVTQQLAVVPPPHQPLQSFHSLDGSVAGSLSTFTGHELDWVVHSWLNAPQMKFSALRLTLWLGPQTQVPHLAFEFGLRPDLFFFIDYLPRVDVWTDLSYAERYYEPTQPTYMALRQNPNLSLFVSRALYIRQTQSPTSLCFTCPATEESFSLLHQTTHEMCSRWLTWIKEAEPVSGDRQPTLAERDLRMRRTIAERDPDNSLVVKMFGAELANQLVRALWTQDYLQGA